MIDDTIHTCSYSCERPGCIRAQRDELVAKVEALRAEVEEMQRRLDREESDHGRTIDQRDAAEDALGRMFQAVTGRVAEWSSAWGYTDAIEEVEEHVAALARQPAAGDGCHCGTCTCNPNMTPAVRFDLSPAQQEGAIREHLIRLGWTPPDEHAVSQPAAPSGTVNVVGMPEFDSLLDHIYECGTAAEGVIEKANAFARAVIARYTPPEGYVLISEEVLRVWGKLDEVRECCRYPKHTTPRSAAPTTDYQEPAMTTETDLLPLPKWMSNYTIPADDFECDKGVMLVDRMHDYARANVARAIAAKDAEIDALRTRLEDTVRDSTNKIEALRTEAEQHLQQAMSNGAKARAAQAEADNLRTEIEKLRAEVAEAREFRDKLAKAIGNEQLRMFIEKHGEPVPLTLRVQAAEARAERLEEALRHQRWCRTCAEDGWESCEEGRKNDALLRDQEEGHEQ